MDEYEDDHVVEGRCEPPRVRDAPIAAAGLCEYDSDDDAPIVTYSLPPASREQQLVIEAVKKHNVVVDAVAGSGKSTTSLQIASAVKDKILLLTYNASLKRDTALRAARLGLENVEVRTYHSYCVRYIDKECHTDAGIMKHLPESLRKSNAVGKSRYDLIIIDECQDMTTVYFDVARHAIAGGNPRLLVVGDRNQSIYQYKGSDPRYLTLAPSLYQSPHKWSRLSLSTSYRITRQMAALVNEIKNNDTPRITAVKDGKKPKYLYCSGAQLAEVIAKTVRENSPEDVFILAPSVRIQPKHRLAHLANSLTRLKVPIYIPNSDEKSPDDSVLAGKAAFITFHQAKGLERKIVFVLSFDHSFFSRSQTIPDGAPNELYVAVTRASSELYLWHNTMPQKESGGPAPMIPYLNCRSLRRLCDITHSLPREQRPYQRVRKPIPSSVTDIVRHIPDFYSDYMMSLVDLEHIRQPTPKIQIPPVVVQRQRFYEEVSDITGTASVAHYEISVNRKCTIREQLRVGNLPHLPMKPEDILRCANLYNCKVSNLNFKKEQITEFKWVSADQFDKMAERLTDVTPGENQFETEVQINGLDQAYRYVWQFEGANGVIDNGTRGTTGYIDIINNGERLFEIKTVSDLTSEHYLQLIMYYYGTLYRGQILEPYMYNVLTDELVKVTVSDDSLMQIMRVLNHVKNHSNESWTDTEFIARGNTTKTAPEIIADCPLCRDTFTHIGVYTELKKIGEI